MPDAGTSGIGMPPRGCRGATGVEEKTVGGISRSPSGVRLPLLPLEAIQETGSLFLL